MVFDICRGVKEVLMRRLKNYYKKQKNVKPEKKNECSTSPRQDYFVVIDFEGTCEEENTAGYIHEIIEFPAILVNARTLELEDEFHRYCRPLEKIMLSKFCQNLTGITQETVNDAKPFSDVLTEFNAWLEKHHLGTENMFVIATDGPWDMGKFLPAQCTLSGIPVPGYASRWVNVRKHYRRYYRAEEFQTPLTLELILENLGMSFEGRPHSGIDDARNIAKILVKMVRDGLDPNVNDDIAYQRRIAEQRNAKK
ncbi:3 -5 exoribonuclease 1 [Paramuricea clavata]|uniref:3 -5 exoribonuclease 1 n=1 Tax=Paramuricea clavata TaxID=317549 RepID=A0A6S7LRZ1_PARCT|nr:3 -5 exoribonuclease 1 [Paramuricea clavata]